MAVEERRRVVVFGLGGTIAMSASEGGGVTPTLSAHELVLAVPGLTETGIEVEVVDFRRLPSASLDFATLTDLTSEISQAVERGPSGVVVTQGTDTIEETSYLLDLYHRHPTPLVVTGAMRNPTMAGADGPANLLAAVLTAAHPQSREYGALVVLNDEIHAARHVRKTHTTALDTFRSPEIGPLGHLREGSVRLHGVRPPRLVIPPPISGAEPTVALHTVVLGDDPDILSRLAGPVDGLIVAAMGGGHVPDRLVEPLADAATRIPVVLASRTGSGSVLRVTYGARGSERDLIGRGLIPAGTLDPLKARILLRALLACGADLSQLHQAFAVAGDYTDHSRWPWPYLYESESRNV